LTSTNNPDLGYLLQGRSANFGFVSRQPLEKICTFLCFRDKKGTKPYQACTFDHIGKWENIPADDQTKILAHCHTTQWNTFAKYRAMVPKKFAYLRGDSKGLKSA
jgi:hypothetical protein